MASPGGTHSALFCDTNVLVRFLTADPPAQARSAREALRQARHSLILTDVIYAELAYVLAEGYSLPPSDVAQHLAGVIDLPSVVVADEDMLRDTAAIFGQGRLDLADSYLAALCRRTEGSAVLSFDRAFDRVAGITRVDPSAIVRGSP